MAVLAAACDVDWGLADDLFTGVAKMHNEVRNKPT